MELYYGHPSGNQIILDEDESTHLLKVNRSRIGDKIKVTDGEGSLFNTQFTEQSKRNCILDILKVEKHSPRNNSLHVAIAPTKNIDRIEWFLEKATESGIEEVSFIICRHSERREIKLDRLNRVVVAAMKQSVKTFLPKLNSPIDFEKFISTNSEGDLLIFSTSAETETNFNKTYRKGNPLIALIGPEGDFHTDEIELALKAGYKKTTLGLSRLRTETAGINVCMLFNFINSYQD